jgi:hypothetical protein
MAFGLLKSLHGPHPDVHPRPQHRIARRILVAIAILIAFLLIAGFIASFFIDGIIRSRAVTGMNSQLQGYHAELDKAHLQLVGGTLTLSGLTIIQDAHPQPPVALIPKLKVHLDWVSLFRGRVVAVLNIYDPRLHIDLPQLTSEATSSRSVQQEGWQQALESVYPFKINLFRVMDGDVVYVDSNDPQRPLHLTDLNLSARNIRNIKSQNNTYPSPIHLETVIADKGKLILDGDANFLATPYAGVKTRYWISHLPLDQFEPELKHANLVLTGGTLESNGLLQYAPWGEQVEVYNGTIDRIRARYLNLPQTVGKEKKQLHEAKQTAKKVNNQPGTLVKVDRLNLVDSDVGYEDRTTKPPFALYVSDFAAQISNFSNHLSQGNAGIRATGKFMDSGDLNLIGNFRPEKQGPDFSINLAIQHTDLTRLNDLLRAYGKLQVARGDFSLFMQTTVTRGEMSGYVKPLFSNLQVYSHEQEKHQPLVKKAYEAAVGAATHIFKNPSTQKVATQVNLSGKLSQPNMNTWQAIVEIVRNAFIKAILPGFERQVSTQQNGG